MIIIITIIIILIIIIIKIIIIVIRKVHPTDLCEMSYADFSTDVPQWGDADAEIKVPSGENTELKRSPFKDWSRSVYSHTYYAYCQGFLSFLPISTLPVHSPAFFSKTSPNFSLCWLWLTHGSCEGPQNKIGHPAGCRFPC